MRVLARVLPSRSLLWVAAVVLLTAVAARGAIATRFSDTDLLGVIGNDKIATVTLAEIAWEDGTMLLLGRDRATRKLEWFHLDPRTRELLGSGAAPFQEFEDFDVSPDGGRAVVLSRKPGALWALDVKEGTWKKIFDNGSQGLQIRSVSQLDFIDDAHVATIVDRLDAEGFVVDSLVLTFDPATGAMQQGVSLPKLRESAMAVIGAEKGWEYWTDILRHGADGSFVFVLQAKKADDTAQTDYLFQSTRDGKVRLVDKSPGGLLPLDYDAATGRVLYRITKDADRHPLMLSADGKTQYVSSEALISGALLPDGRVAGASVAANGLDILGGPLGGRLQKVGSATGYFSVGFLSDGSQAVLVGDREMRYVPLR